VWLQNNCKNGDAMDDPTFVVATRNSRNGETDPLSWVNAVIVEYKKTVSFLHHINV
jgi:hypothetical protein